MHGEEHVGEAEDGRQHVVEVVGDAAGQLADDFHLLALRKARFQRLLLGRVDDVEDGRLARAAGRERAHIDARDVIAFGAGGDLDRHVVHAPGDDLLQAVLDRRAGGRIGSAAQRLGGRHAGAGGAVEHHAAEGGVGADDAAVRAEHGDAERRRLEEARETGAGFIALELGGAFTGEIDDGERKPLAAGDRPRQQAGRQDAAVLARQVDVERGGLVARIAGEARDEPGPFAGSDVGELEALIDHRLGRASDPAGERAVDMQQGAVGGDRGKTDGRGVELAQLHFDTGEAHRFATAIGGDVGEAPQHEAWRVARALGDERLDRQLQRAPRALAGQHPPNREFLGQRLAALGGARQAEQRRARRRIAGQKLLQGDEPIDLAGTDHPLEGGVGVHRHAVAAGDQHADVETVGRRLHHIGHGLSLPDAHVAGRVGEEEEQPHRGEHAEHADEHRCADAAGDDAKGDDRADDDRADGGQIARHALHR